MIDVDWMIVCNMMDDVNAITVHLQSDRYDLYLPHLLTVGRSKLST